MQRTGFKRPTLERKRSVPTLGTGRGVHAPSSDVVVSVPKRAYVRSKTLREAYRLIPCQWPVMARIPNANPTPPWTDVKLPCGVEDGTVCCAHSNWGEHGKGAGIKADDSRGASLCGAHHGALDQGSRLSAEERRAGFEWAHRRSVALLVAMGKWPADVEVPEFDDDEVPP